MEDDHLCMHRLCIHVHSKCISNAWVCMYYIFTAQNAISNSVSTRDPVMLQEAYQLLWGQQCDEYSLYSASAVGRVVKSAYIYFTEGLCSCM